MKPCSNNHQRIVYEPFTIFGPEYAACPLCTAMAEIERYQREIEAYRKLESAVVGVVEGSLEGRIADGVATIPISKTLTGNQPMQEIHGRDTEA
jgi:hypothetical protein